MHSFKHGDKVWVATSNRVGIVDFQEDQWVRLRFGTSGIGRAHTMRATQLIPYQTHWDALVAERKRRRKQR